MKRIVGFASLIVLIFVLSASAQSAAPAVGDDAAFLAKAQELTKDKVSRLDKLQALQTFVRDEIAQAKTQYG